MVEAGVLTCSVVEAGVLTCSVVEAGLFLHVQWLRLDCSYMFSG